MEWHEIVLDGEPADGPVYGETPLPFAGEGNPGEPVCGETPLPFANENRPERIRQMRRLFVYGRENAETRAENFYRQAKYMEDYEDDAPWSGSFAAYYPTYQDLTISQIRGYFSWRTRVRRGELSPIAATAVYLYIYELLNGIGAASPTESLEKLRAFEEKYFGAGYGDARIQGNLRRWMFEYAVLQDLPLKVVLKYVEPATLEMDNMLLALSEAEKDEEAEKASSLPEDYAGAEKVCPGPEYVRSADRECFSPENVGRGYSGSNHVGSAVRGSSRSEILESDEKASAESENDENIVKALILIGGKKYEKSPAFAGERGRRLLAEIWRKTRDTFAPEGKPFFEACFGRQVLFRWEPLSNAVYDFSRQPYASERIYILNKCRSCICRNGVWQMSAYDKVFFHLHWVKELLHAADARLRRYLGTGKYLTEKPEEAWAQPFIDAVLQEDRRAREEAAKPKIRINLSGLEKIRRDALVTQKSLLVEEEPLPGIFWGLDVEEKKPLGQPSEERRSLSLSLEGKASEEKRFLGLYPEERTSLEQRSEGEASGERTSFVRQTEGEASEERFSLGVSLGEKVMETPDSLEQNFGGIVSAEGSSLEMNTERRALEPGDFSGNGSGGNFWETTKESETFAGKELPGETANGLLDAVQTQILRALLRGESVDALLRENHLMPSIAADEINERLYDEIGDNILECEDDRLSIFEDYKEDLENLL